MPDNLSKIKNLISDQPSKWQEEAKFREENKDWLDASFRIALMVLRTLRERNISKEEFAASLNMSIEDIKKVLKGNSNLTLELISKIENVLRIKLTTF